MLWRASLFLFAFGIIGTFLFFSFFRFFWVRLLLFGCLACVFGGGGEVLGVVVGILVLLGGRLIIIVRMFLVAVILVVGVGLAPIILLIDLFFVVAGEVGLLVRVLLILDGSKASAVEKQTANLLLLQFFFLFDASVLFLIVLVGNDVLDFADDLLVGCWVRDQLFVFDDRLAQVRTQLL